MDKPVVVKARLSAAFSAAPRFPPAVLSARQRHILVNVTDAIDAAANLVDI